MNATQQPVDGDGHPTGGTDSPLSDQPLLDLLDVLVDDLGRVAAAEALGVNYRTLVNCYNSRRVSRRMRQVLQEFRDAGGVGGDDPGDVDDDDVSGIEHESLERRVAVLEDENRGLRELVESQADQLEELVRLVAALEGREGKLGEAEAEPAGVDNDREQDWRPPRRRHGMPDAGAVTVEVQPDEEHAFGPAAPPVAEWRELQVRVEKADSRVDRDRDEARRWELEVEMLGTFHLTLPPDTYQPDDARRAGPRSVAARGPRRGQEGVGPGKAESVAAAGAYPGPVAAVDGRGNILRCGVGR